MGQGLVAGISIVVLVLVLYPAWSSMDTYDSHNATNIGLQADADAQFDPQINELLDYVKAHPQGRVYAGAPTNWGNDLTVGDVPVFKYLESKDIDEVGYTLRTASLMTDPEYFFDDTNPGDYPLFGIGYIITPRNMSRRSRPTRCCARARTACGRCLTRATSTSTTRPVCSTPPGRTSGPRAPPCSTRRCSRSERDLTVAFNGGEAPAAHRARRNRAGIARSRGHAARRPGERHGAAQQSTPIGAPLSSSARPTTRVGTPRSTDTRHRPSWWRPRWSGSTSARACMRSSSPTAAMAPTRDCCAGAGRLRGPRRCTAGVASLGPYAEPAPGRPGQHRRGRQRREGRRRLTKGCRLGAGHRTQWSSMPRLRLDSGLDSDLDASGRPPS